MTLVTFLLFDAYGTLVELDDFYGRLQRGFLQRGYNFSDDAVKNAAHREMRYYIEHAKTARDFNSHQKLRHECAQIIAEELSSSNFVVAHDVAYRTLDAAIVFAPFAETHEVLSHLQNQGVSMAVASNWDYSLPQVLNNLDLTRYFDFVLTSAGTGVEKPDGDFFRVALHEIQKSYPQILPRQIVYVGDHYEKDVLAPQSVGMSARWLVRDARGIASGDTHCAAGVVPMRSLRDLLSMVDLHEDRVLDVQTVSGSVSGSVSGALSDFVSGVAR